MRSNCPALSSLLTSAIVTSGFTCSAQAQSCPAAVNQALVFNGGQVATIADAPALNPGAEVTVECWVRPDQAGQIGGLVSKWNDVSANQRGFLLWLYNGVPWFYVSSNGGNYPRVEATSALSVGVWHHVAGTYAAGMLKIYVDGLWVASAPVSGSPSIFPCAAPVLIGKDSAGTSMHYFKGAIDEVRIWNAARSSDDIWAYRDVRVSSSADHLIGSWNFDEFSGQSILDAAQPHNVGVLGNIPNNNANIPSRAPSNNVKLASAHAGWTTAAAESVACQPVGTSAQLRLAAGVQASSVDWYKSAPGGSNVPLLDGASGHGSVISGAHTSMLNVDGLTTMDSAGYFAILNTDCGFIYSSSATINVCGTPACRADFDQDGFLTFEDFDAFVAVFEAGAAESDFNGDGFLDFTDFDAFIQAFELGC